MTNRAQIYEFYKESYTNEIFNFQTNRSMEVMKQIKISAQYC